MHAPQLHLTNDLQTQTSPQKLGVHTQ